MNSVYWHLKLVDKSQSQYLLLVTQLMDGTSKLSVESKQVEISGRITAKDGEGVGYVVGLLLIEMEGIDDGVLVGATDGE